MCQRIVIAMSVFVMLTSAVSAQDVPPQTNVSAPQILRWGMAGDIPQPGDYDGDGKADLAIYRPSTSEWYVLLSSRHFQQYLYFVWGKPGDVPVANDYNGDGLTQIAVYRPSTGQWLVAGSFCCF